MINITKELTKDGYIIRKLEKTDYQKGFCNTLSVLSPTFMSEDNFNYLFKVIDTNPNHLIIVIEKDNSIIATGKLLVEYRFSYSKDRSFGKVAHIEDIAVNKEFHGKGYGKEIVSHLIKIAKNLECYKCILSCNEHNIGFYEKLGFKKYENTMRANL